MKDSNDSTKHDSVPAASDAGDVQQHENLQAEIQALGDEAFTRRKDRFKCVRTVIQFLILALSVAVLINLFFHLKTYHPYDDSAIADSGEDTGFIAISYFGVDRIGDSSTLIGKDLLEEHLAALKDQGYVTITQKDIEDYYQNGKPLPKRALYLMFEDGRRDTAIFADNLMERFNYKATMMTYAGVLDYEDPKFLKPKELRDMEESSFWEMGTNGYRLEYINVMDRYGNYIGEINPLRYAMIHPYLGRHYNHYLMDYIRDKDGVPKESYNHMKRRVTYDYEHLRDVYEDKLGYVPHTYVLMHSNTGRFGNNRDISPVNEQWMRNLFTMNFNREGYCFNQRNSSIYDLTRMQPQPYWPVNHLLMRIKYDINQPITFKQGDSRHQQDWVNLKGAAQIKAEKYILTTLPEGEALSRLQDSDGFRDVRIRTRLEGNAFGAQKIYFRASDDLSRYDEVSLRNGKVVVTEKIGGVEKELYREKLAVILGEPIPSKEEAKREAEVRENEAFARYADSPDEAKEYLLRAQARKDQPAASVEDGAEPDEVVTSFHARSFHDIEIAFKDDHLTVMVDEKKAAEDIPLANTQKGGIFLGAGWKPDAWSQRNLADDVYDAVFDRFTISANTGKDAKDERVLFTMQYTGLEYYEQRAKDAWEAILKWFLTYL
ncbi:hypothetical protein [Mitsuokella multacida]|uniref:hypothetical protein n=2 Tax=Mitsuokella multacida TaxID=52226 RepID=UPI003132EAB8